MVASGGRRQSGRPYLDGQFLVAMPGMEDTRFARSVVYMCAHSDEGAMGIAINRIASEITFEQLLRQLDILGGEPGGGLPAALRAMPVHAGGPVETGRGFVLHSSDYFVENSTLPIDEDISLTATLDILRAIAGGNGPRHAMLALGYAGWAPGQLENEIKANGWLHCGAVPDLIFDRDIDTIYDRTLASMGIDPAMLSPAAGTA